MTKVLAAIDGSEHAMHALEQAARILGASTEWVFLSIVPPWSPAVAVAVNEDPTHDQSVGAPESGVMSHGATAGSTPYAPTADSTAAANDALYDYYRTAQRQAATRAGVAGEHVIDEAKPQKRKIGRAICDGAAAHGVDLIVIGSHGSSHTGEVLLGSVSQYVLHHAPCPVLTVRANH